MDQFTQESSASAYYSVYIQYNTQMLSNYSIGFLLRDYCGFNSIVCDLKRLTVSTARVIDVVTDSLHKKERRSGYAHHVLYVCTDGGARI